MVKVILERFNLGSGFSFGVNRRRECASRTGRRKVRPDVSVGKHWILGGTDIATVDNLISRHIEDSIGEGISMAGGGATPTTKGFTTFGVFIKYFLPEMIFEEGRDVGELPGDCSVGNASLSIDTVVKKEDNIRHAK